MILRYYFIDKTEIMSSKVRRVRELVELLERLGGNGWSLPLDLQSKKWDQQSGFEETERHQYDVYKYHTLSTEEQPET